MHVQNPLLQPLGWLGKIVPMHPDHGYSEALGNPWWGSTHFMGPKAFSMASGHALEAPPIMLAGCADTCQALTVILATSPASASNCCAAVHPSWCAYVRCGGRIPRSTAAETRLCYVARRNQLPARQASQSRHPLAG